MGFQSDYDGLIYRDQFTARYATRCEVAPDHEIHPGDEIAIVAEEDGDTLGYGCPVCLAEIRAARAQAFRRQ